MAAALSVAKDPETARLALGFPVTDSIGDGKPIGCMNTITEAPEQVFCPNCGTKIFATLGAHMECQHCGQPMLVERSVLAPAAPPVMPPPVLPRARPQRGFHWTGVPIFAIERLFLPLLYTVGLGLTVLVFVWASDMPIQQAIPLWLVVTGYLLPAANAAYRKHPNATAILALNALLGWTLLGWIGSLVWSCTAFRRD